jgi:FtsP/CotA-like multicopper oxidase with cupredoxin domain
VPEAFMDTMLVNGTDFPFVKVDRKAYRLRILNASNDRSLNLQLYYAKSNTVTRINWNTHQPTLQTDSGEVPMVPAVPHPGDPTWPATWPTDGRDGGVPDPAAAGPEMIQIGTEGGLLPAPAVLPNTPVGYEYNRRNIVVLNVSNKTLFLGPAERADVIVDFSQVPAGSNIIMYNDSPAPVPASDPRYDYYTDNPDLTGTGGAPSTKAGYAPNTRTVMQFRVGADFVGPDFLQALYQNALGHVPDAGGRAFWMSTLNAGMSPNWVASMLLSMHEYNTRLVTEQYQSILGRAPDPGGLGMWTAALDGGLRFRMFQSFLYGSSEYRTNRVVNTTNQAYVETLYQRILGRASDPAGSTYWTGQITTGVLSRANVAYAFLSGPERLSSYINAQYQAILLRPADPGGLAYWTSAMVTGMTEQNLMASLYGSAEYLAMYPLVVTVVPTGPAAAPFNLTALENSLKQEFVATQPPMVVPETTYPDITVGNTNNHAASDTYSKIQDTSLTFNPVGVPVVGAPVTGTGAIGSVSITSAGAGYTTAPLVTFTGATGSGAGALATLSVNNIAVTTGGSGYTAPPTVALNGGGGSGATAVAVLTGDVVTGVTVTNGGTGYSSMPTVSFTPVSGGPGGGAAATATGGVSEVSVTSGGLNYTGPLAVVFTGGGFTATATANASFDVTMPMEPKAIQELFELNYGRMNATLGVELPFTNFNIQTTIPLGYIDPLTESINMSATPGPVIRGDGTQIWKITHNGVDTHAIHFHLFNVQLINRVGWDGAIVPPDANELGWKETVRMHPLQDAIVALRPVTPTLPWTIPNSSRPLDPTQPVGAQMSVTNPADGNLITVTNDMTDFGWEYVWHCHLLGHEENDMMRPVAFHTEPQPNTLTGASAAAPNVVLNWINPTAVAAGPIPAVTSYTIDRATNATFTAGLTTFTTTPAATYTDTTAVSGTTYYYRVKAIGTVTGGVNDSTWSNTTMVIVP